MLDQLKPVELWTHAMYAWTDWQLSEPIHKQRHKILCKDNIACKCHLPLPGFIKSKIVSTGVRGHVSKLQPQVAAQAALAPTRKLLKSCTFHRYNWGSGHGRGRPSVIKSQDGIQLAVVKLLDCSKAEFDLAQAGVKHHTATRANDNAVGIDVHATRGYTVGWHGNKQNHTMEWAAGRPYSQAIRHLFESTGINYALA